MGSGWYTSPNEKIDEISARIRNFMHFIELSRMKIKKDFPKFIIKLKILNTFSCMISSSLIYIYLYFATITAMVSFLNGFKICMNSNACFVSRYSVDDRYFECCLIRTFAISNKITGPLRARNSRRLLYIYRILSNKPAAGLFFQPL